MPRALRAVRLVAAALLLGICWPARSADPARVVLVSVDGLGPGDVASMPRLDALARRGVRGTLRPVFPTLTWPNHTTLVSGQSPRRHGVIGNRVFLRSTSTIQPYSTGPGLDALHVDNLLTAASRAGIRAGALLWPLTQGMKDLACNLPEVYVDRDVPANAVRSGDRRALGQLLIEESALLDHLVTRKALECAAEPGLRLLLVHYVAVDTWRHRSGTNSLAVGIARDLVDAQIGRLVDALGPATTFVVVSDHGFSEVQRMVDLNRVLHDKRLLDRTLLGRGGSGSGTRNRDALKVKRSSFTAMAVQGSGFAYVYATDVEARAQAEAALRAHRCVGEVHVNTAGLPRFDLPPPGGSARAGLSDGPDLLVLPASGCGFRIMGARESVGRIAIHGGPPDTPGLGAVLVAAGPGIRSGRTASARSPDIAPTIARLLGLRLDYPVDGRVLTEILD